MNNEKDYQNRVNDWMQACFGKEISADQLERGDRLLEEVLELLQSNGYPSNRVNALKNYVWNRPPGEPHQEVGGVMVTLAAYCNAHSLSMQQAAEDELERVWTKVEKIRAKQAAKPTGSALPVAQENYHIGDYVASYDDLSPEESALLDKEADAINETIKNSTLISEKTIHEETFTGHNIGNEVLPDYVSPKNKK